MNLIAKYTLAEKSETLSKIMIATLSSVKTIRDTASKKSFVEIVPGWEW